jgi:hypothetical protein
VEKEEPGDEEAAPAAQVSFFFLSRETISRLRHSTTIRELSNLFIPPVFFFFLLDKIGPYHTITLKNNDYNRSLFMV